MGRGLRCLGRRLRWGMCAGLWMLGIGHAAAQVDPVAMALAGDAQAPRAAAAPIELRWSDTAMSAHWARLSFELDGVDVTAMVERQAEGARLSLPIPLSRGPHELRVVYGAADGSLVEWARWSFAVAGDPVWHAQGDISARLNQLLHNRGALVANAPRGAQLEGAAKLQAQREADDVAIDARAEVWLNTRRDANIRDNTLDLGEFLVEARAGGAQWLLGHQQLGYDSLIHSAFLRRGLSARFSSDGRSVSGFALRSEPTVGAQNFLGPMRSRERVSGLVYEQSLWADADSALAVTAGLVSGSGNDLQGAEDADALANAPLHSGTAWSLGGAGSWWNGRLRARLELAGSRYDWDGGGLSPLPSGRESDLAHALTLDANIPAAGGASVWNVGYDHQDVGTFFRSVAHVGLPADKVTDRLRLSWRQGEWAASANWTYRQTNANDLPDLPRIVLRQTDALLSWAPTPSAEPAWYGSPSLTFSLADVRQRQRTTPSGFFGVPVDNRSWQAGVTGALNHADWSTNLGLGRGAYTDMAQATLSNERQTLNWGAFVRLGEHWTVGPTVEWARETQVSSGDRQLVRTASLFTDFALIPDRLIGNLNIGLNRSRRTVDSQRETNRFAVGELIWRLQKAATNRAGWDLRLSFSHQDFEDVLDASRTGVGNQVFLGLTMTLPVTTRD